MGQKAGIHKSTGGWLLLDCPFELKDALKELVGWGSYRWDQPTRKWFVLEAYAQEVYDLFVKSGFEVDIDAELIGKKALAPGSNPFIAIFSSIDNTDVKRNLYRGISKIIHPDIWPDGADLMKLLNDAYKQE